MNLMQFKCRALLLLRLMVAASSPALHACLAHADTTRERQLPILVSGLRQQQASTREANELAAQALPRRRAADLTWNPRLDPVPRGPKAPNLPSHPGNRPERADQ